VDTLLATATANGTDSNPAAKAISDAGTQLQGQVKRSRTEITEAVLSRTGAVVQQKFSQGMHEAAVIVEKVRLSASLSD
jgi:hypothetical protein